MSCIVCKVGSALVIMGLTASMVKAMPAYPPAAYHTSYSAPYLASYPQAYAGSQPPSFLPAKKSGFGEWRHWMQNQLNGRQWRSGDGNIFEDAKGFYRWMGNGNTRYKFYFDVDFQLEMDAWLRGRNRSATQKQSGYFQQYRGYPSYSVPPTSPPHVPYHGRYPLPNYR